MTRDVSGVVIKFGLLSRSIRSGGGREFYLDLWHVFRSYHYSNGHD